MTNSDFNFEITPIRVLRSRTKIIDKHGKQVLARDNVTTHDENIINNNLFGGLDTNGKLQGLEDHLNQESMNQVLLQCNIANVIDIHIDEAQWIKNNKIIDENSLRLFDCDPDHFRKKLSIQHPKVDKKEVFFFFYQLCQVRKQVASPICMLLMLKHVLSLKQNFQILLLIHMKLLIYLAWSILF